MNRRTILIISAAAAGLMLLALAAFVWPGFLVGGDKPHRSAASPTASASPTSSANYLPGGPVPAQANAICQQLVSGTQEQQRAALTPEVAAQLPAGRPYPPGATIELDDTSWHEQDGYANAMGTLVVPGQPPQEIEIGFSQQASGVWLVTFAEPVA